MNTAPPLFIDALDSPAGWLVIEADQAGVTAIRFSDTGLEECRPSESTRLAAAQLGDYFDRRRTAFDVPLSLHGTAFQLQVWNALREIPFGVTVSYETLAIRLGGREKTRAVGLANGKNPVSIIVPCHRVIGANGSLVGYAGGLMRKRWLLDHESDQQSLPL